MQAYDVRRGHGAVLEGQGLRKILEARFGSAEEQDGVFRVRQGAIEEMSTWFDGKTLYVDTNMRRDVDDETAAATIQAYNAFLEEATGFTAKQRRKRLQKKAKDGKL